MSTAGQTQKARAAVVRAAGGPFLIEDIEVASPRDEEVLVRMVGTGVCHTDIVFRDGGFPMPMPVVIIKTMKTITIIAKMTKNAKTPP